MTDDELMAYLVECVQNIYFGEELTDQEFLTICTSIGAIPAEILLQMTEMEGEPAEIARALGGRVRRVEVSAAGTEERIAEQS